MTDMVPSSAWRAAFYAPPNRYSARISTHAVAYYGSYRYYSQKITRVKAIANCGRRCFARFELNKFAVSSRFSGKFTHAGSGPDVIIVRTE